MRAYTYIDIYIKEAENYENLETAPPPKRGLMAMFASLAYNLPVFAKSQAFMSLPVVKRGIKRTTTGRTLAAPTCGLCNGDHPAAVADRTPMTYLYQLIHIRNWENANLHIT